MNKGKKDRAKTGAKPEQISLKSVELKLVSELMLNSRRSDRELARAVGVSQPTVSRVVKKLEERGIVKEYTMIPDLPELGYTMIAFTFVKLRKELTRKDLEEVDRLSREVAEKGFKNIMTLRGIGLGYDSIIVSVHEDYSSYVQLVDDIKQFPFSDLSSIQSFLVNMSDKDQYRPLTFSALARHVAGRSEGKAENHKT